MANAEPHLVSTHVKRPAAFIFQFRRAEMNPYMSSFDIWPVLGPYYR